MPPISTETAFCWLPENGSGGDSIHKTWPTKLSMSLASVWANARVITIFPGVEGNVPTDDRKRKKLYKIAIYEYDVFYISQKIFVSAHAPPRLICWRKGLDSFYTGGSLDFWNLSRYHRCQWDGKMDFLKPCPRLRATYSFVKHYLPRNAVYAMMVLMEPIKAPIIEQVKHAKVATGNPYSQTQQVNGGIRSILQDIAKPCSEIIGNHRLSFGMIFRVE